ncbi:hypothetical protein SAMN05216316_1789 [Nitrosovibrio sp. Nv6]|nr:hypothetical protein SAMN05216316_1789 [Nitrosovibrio sp. Nv6]
MFRYAGWNHPAGIGFTEEGFPPRQTKETTGKIVWGASDMPAHRLLPRMRLLMQGNYLVFADKIRTIILIDAIKKTP